MSTITDITARLRAAMPNNVHVLNAFDLSAIEKGSLPVPGVYLLLPHHRVIESTKNASSTRYESVWHVVVSVRNVANPTSGVDAYDEAEALAKTARAALMGWVPQGAATPLKPTTPRYTASYKAGAYLLPFAFSFEYVERGN